MIHRITAQFLFYPPSHFFGKHVNSHLMGYLNKDKLNHECQSAFRQKHSCFVFCLIWFFSLYVLLTIFQLYRDGSSWVELVLSWELINVSWPRTQRSEAGEARTRGPSVSSQALYHWAIALPKQPSHSVYSYQRTVYSVLILHLLKPIFFIFFIHFKLWVFLFLVKYLYVLLLSTLEANKTQELYIYQ